MMFWYGNGIGAWSYVLMSVSMVLFWGLVILAIVALIRYVGRPVQPTSGPQLSAKSPEQVLADRFARGEIDEPEYRSRLDVLHGTRPVGGS